VPRPEHPRYGALLRRTDGRPDVDALIGLARGCEAAGFAALIAAEHLEPVTLLAALSPHTSRIGLVAPAATDHDEPYHVARKVATLDHICGGRAGWLPGGTRSDRVVEFVDVVTGLWGSYAADALLRDRATGRYYRRDGRRAIDHRGRHFTVAGPLNLAPPPQGHPVLFASGGSAFAARVGEVILAPPVGPDEAVAYRRGLDAAVTAAGRDPGDVRVWSVLPETAGSPVAVADRIEALWSTGAVDGFAVSLPSRPERFRAEVLPILGGRVPFRPAEGTTLRERLELPHPSRGGS
jgi:alkanesulfonate monooxygenase SsuD/methylene tetrahydromethanopterin reductase-like flavin-dependent oxidoreductase (luciferase family)